jgi:hypothetical protein
MYTVAKVPLPILENRIGGLWDSELLGKDLKNVMMFEKSFGHSDLLHHCCGRK